MLTAKQIHDLKPGYYPNWRLMKMFPKQQGPGRSAKMKLTKDERGRYKETLLNQFTGKVMGYLRRKT